MPIEPQNNFYELTPERILQAVESLNVRCTGRILQLNSMENRVYEAEIEVPDVSALKSRYDAFRVVKFYRPGRWSRQQILDEHKFASDLAREEIAVVAALEFPGLNSTLGASAGILFAAYPKFGGRTLDELNQKQLERIGRLIARLHIVGASQTFEHRAALTPQNYAQSALDFLENGNFVPEVMRGRFFEVAKKLIEVGTGLYKGFSLQRIHGDLHCGNVLWDRDDCTLVDFDDVMMGPCVQDIWLLMPGRDEYALEAREQLLRGYEQMRPFNRAELSLIELLRTFRIIHFCAWIAKRWEDPAFPRVFSSFGSLEYWRDQLITLEEQLQLLPEG